MNTSTAQPAAGEHYFVPQPSLYPVILSAGMFLLALGFVQSINNFGAGKWFSIGGVAVIIYVLFGWFGKVIGESQGGAYRDWEDKSFRYGMIWFIATEVMFFAAFFGALFYVRAGSYSSSSAWPSSRRRRSSLPRSDSASCRNCGTGTAGATRRLGGNRLLM